MRVVKEAEERKEKILDAAEKLFAAKGVDKTSTGDILDAEEYSRASGMVSLAGGARYLISPVLAGALLTLSDIRLLLFLDICTFF